MLDQLDSLPAVLLALILTIGTAHAYVGMWESSLKPETLKNISNKILSSSFRKGARKILELHLNINSKVFGRKILSTRSLKASLILTSIWGSLLIGIYSFKYPVFREWMLNIIELSSLRWIALAALCTVLTIDYISICLTRKIYRATLSNGKKSFIAAIAIDLSKSVAVYYIGISLFKFILVKVSFLPPIIAIQTWLTPTSLTTSLEVLKDFDFSRINYTGNNIYTFTDPLQTQVSYAFPEGVFFTTSLLTSLWLWLYIAAYGVAFLAVKIDLIKSFLLHRMNIEEKPLSSLMTIATTVIILISIIKHVSTLNI